MTADGGNAMTDQASAGSLHPGADAAQIADAGERIVAARLDHPIARRLLEELDAEYARRYPELVDGSGGAREMRLFPPFVFEPPYGAAFLVLHDDRAIAGGAFMELDERTVELKRIWTASAYRRRGLARRIVAVLEAEAAARGYSRSYLTTGPRQPEAVRTYLGAGYTPLFRLDDDWESIGGLAFEKRLEPTGPRTRPRYILARLKHWRQRRIADRGRREHGLPNARLDDPGAPWAANPSTTP